MTDNSTTPPVTGPAKPAQPTANIADASVCGRGGPGCDRSVLATPVRNTTPGGSGGSCGANGSSCPTPQPAAPPAPGAPTGPSNAGIGGTGPGHTGGPGAARLNADGPTNPDTTQPVAVGPRLNTLDPNQSANPARGPPADPTNPNIAPINPGATKAPAQLPDGAVVARPGSTPTDGFQRVTIDGQQVDMPRDSLNWLNPDSSARNLNTDSGQKLMVGTCTAGSVQCVAHSTDGSSPNISFTRENPGVSVPDAMNKQAADQFFHSKVDPSYPATPSPSDVAATRADNAARQAQGARNANKVLDGLSFAPYAGPVVRTARGIRATSDLFSNLRGRPNTETPAAGPGPTAPAAPQAQTPGRTPGVGEPAADPGPGRVLPRPNRTPGDRVTRPAPRPEPAAAPAGRPRPGAGARPGGPAGSRPGQRVGTPQPDREPALVGSGAPTQPARGGRSPEALATPGTRTAPARPQAPRIEDPAPVRTLPDTQPAPEAAPGGRPDLPTPAVRPQPGVGTTTDTGPSTPGQRSTGQTSGPDAGPNPLARPGGQPDGPATVGGGEKARGDVYHNGQLYRWDDQQQRWNSIARVDPGAALPPTGGNPAITSSGHPRIAELDTIFKGQPDELERYQKLSLLPSDQLSDADYKFVHGIREQLSVAPGEPMTKVLGQGAIDNMLNGTYSPDQVYGFIARGRDTDQLRTPKQLRDGLALTPPLNPDGSEAWPSPIPADGSHAYQLTWQARTDRGLSVPYGAPKGAAVPHIDNLIPGDPRRDGEPFTGTGTTAGGIPEWHANGAPITGPAQIWHLDQAGNRRLYADYDPTTRTWKLAP